MRNLAAKMCFFREREREGSAKRNSSALKTRHGKSGCPEI